MYGSLYYAAYLLLFSVAFVIYSFFSARSRDATLRPLLRSGLGVAAVGFVLTLPLTIGLLRSYNDPNFAVPAGETHVLTHSADLLSLISPSPNHPVLRSLRASQNEDLTRDDVALGYIAVVLAVVGAVTAWRREWTIFWVVLGLVTLVLSLGPQLQVGGNVTGIPLPFALVQDAPAIAAIGKVSRFLVLTRLCMAVLAAWGAVWVLSTLTLRLGKGLTPFIRRALPLAAVLALLLVELPIYPRYMEPISIPQGFQTIQAENPKSKIQNPKSAIMELPFATRQAETLGRRMRFQTTHGLPIMGGYLSRTYTSPITDDCSPFWGFISFRDVPQEWEDIATPMLEARPLDVLRFYNIDYLALYSTYGDPQDPPLEPETVDIFHNIIGHVSDGNPFYQDSYVSLYRVDQTRPTTGTPSFHVGNGWYPVESSSGSPFRWLNGTEGALCVFAPQPVTASLTLEATSFGQERTAQLTVDGKEVASGAMPTGGAFATMSTEPIKWPQGITRVRVTTGGPAITPQSLDPAQKDNRPLTLGVRSATLEEVQGQSP